MTEPSRAAQPYRSCDETIDYPEKRAPAGGEVLPPARVQRQNLEANL